MEFRLRWQSIILFSIYFTVPIGLDCLLMDFGAMIRHSGLPPKRIFIPLALWRRPDNLRRDGFVSYPLDMLRSVPS
jgi:hypothetical protein